MTDLRQTPEYAKYMESIGWDVERKNGVNYFIRRIPIIGSFMKVQRPTKIDFVCIDELIHRYKVFQIVMEPQNLNHQSLVTNHGFYQSRLPFVPSKTVYIDLTKTDKKLLSEMHYKTRYNIKKASKNKGLNIQISKDIEKFANFWQECARRQRGMFLSQKKEIVALYKAFSKKADLIFIIHSKKLFSGILLLHAENVSYYMYAASSDKGKKLFAPTLCVWEAFKLSKKRGSKIFDFEGIYDPRFPINTWKGFTRFKKSFGGREVEHPGAFRKYRIPI